AAGFVAAVVAVGLANSAYDPYLPIVLAIVLTGAAVAFSLTLDRDDSARTAKYTITVRTLSVLLLVGAGLLLLFSNGAHPSAVTAVLAIGMLVLGLGVVVAPFMVRLWTDLMAERAGRVREEQRA